MEKSKGKGCSEICYTHLRTRLKISKKNGKWGHLPLFSMASTIDGGCLDEYQKLLFLFKMPSHLNMNSHLPLITF